VLEKLPNLVYLVFVDDVVLDLEVNDKGLRYFNLSEEV